MFFKRNPINVKITLPKKKWTKCSSSDSIIENIKHNKKISPNRKNSKIRILINNILFKY